MVRILRYERTSIAQIAWLHNDYGPMALCISATEQGKTTRSGGKTAQHEHCLVEPSGSSVCPDWT
jgi:hypothetical protein